MGSAPSKKVAPVDTAQNFQINSTTPQISKENEHSSLALPEEDDIFIQNVESMQVFDCDGCDNYQFNVTRVDRKVTTIKILNNQVIENTVKKSSQVYGNDDMPIIYWKSNGNDLAKNIRVMGNTNPSKTRIDPPKTFSDQDTDQEILTWRTTIQNLLANKPLMDYAKSKTRTNFKDLNQLAEFINNSPAKNDTEKAWVVYVWLSENIAYDAEGFRTGNYGRNDAQGVFLSGKAVCAGFSNLFEQICRLINIECITISGIAKGFGYVPGSRSTNENHAWNAIKLNEKWYYVESTWGTGVVSSSYKFSKNFQPYYFLTPGDVFKTNHFSHENQLHKKLTLDEFYNFPESQLMYHVLGLKTKELNSEFLEVKQKPYVIEFTTQDDLDLFITFKKQNSSNETWAIYQKDSESSPKKYCFFLFLNEKNVNYEISLFGKENVKEKKSEFLFKCYLKLVSDEPNYNLPKCSINFDNGVRLLSHQSTLIYFEENPLKMEFSAPEKFSFIGNVENVNTKAVTEGCVLIQRDKSRTGNLFVDVILPQVKQTMKLNLFLKESSKKQNFDYFTSFYLIKTSQNVNIEKFVTVYNQDKLDFFIYEPVSQFLKKNKSYKFKYFIKNASKAAFCSGPNWEYLEKSDQEENIYYLEKSFDKLGNLNLFGQFSKSANMDCICSYQVIA